MNCKKSFSSYDRPKYLDCLDTDFFDLLVIGGGATGSGIALDAASRGLKTALIEKADFSSGTSSKSTKLIHGGLRYLKQFEIGLVRESGREREIVNRIAPHLCVPEKMLLPLIEGGSFGKLATSVGLWVYDRLANVDDDDKRVMLSKSEALKKEPLLHPNNLKGAGYYAEYRTDDSRLTIELIKKSVEYGAIVSNYVEATSFIHEDGKVRGIECLDTLTGDTFSIRAKKTVSAGGPWVDKLCTLNSSLSDKRLHLTKGVHIVVPHYRFALSQSIYFDVPDGRMIFAIPRGKVTYIGTTDTEYKGPLDRVVATEEDRDYLLRAINNMFPDILITRYDVISNWAGLRPLIHESGKSPSELSRQDEIFESPDGLISIAGGKLTGFRKMSERVVDKVMKELCREYDYTFVNTTTKEISLTHHPLKDNDAVDDYIKSTTEKCQKIGLDKYYGWYLVTNYGKQTEYILDHIQSNNYADPELAIVHAELLFCLKYEMVQRAEDFLVRRTGRLYFDIQSIENIREMVMTTLTQELNWSSTRLENEQSRLDRLLQDATHYYLNEVVEESEITTVHSDKVNS